MQPKVSHVIRVGVLGLLIWCSTEFSPPPEFSRAEDREAIQRSFLERIIRGGQSMPAHAITRAIQQWERIPKSRPWGSHRPRNRDVFNTGGVVGETWFPIGPSPIREGPTETNGLVSTIAVVPSQPDVLYIGAAGGGVWRTRDGGATWKPIFDQQLTLAVWAPNAIAIDPNNTSTLYVGTSPAFIGSERNHIFRSLDGGDTWTDINTQFEGLTISSLIVDPADSNVLYLAGYDGVYYSHDRAVTWTRGAGGAGNGSSLVLDPSSPDDSRILYAAIYGRGILKSIDGGLHWTAILTRDTPAVNAVFPQPPTADNIVGSSAPALPPSTSPPDPRGIQVVYVTAEVLGADPALENFKSTDQGATWVKTDSVGFDDRNVQGGYDLTLFVDPASPGDGLSDILYWGGVTCYRSADSGDTFVNIQNGMHADFHSWNAHVDGTGATTLYAGNDGGIWKSSDRGDTWSGTGVGGQPTLNSGGLQIALFHNLDLKYDAAATSTVGALQDNGIVTQSSGTVVWTNPTGCDGWDAVFGHTDVDTAYLTVGCPATFEAKSQDAGLSWPININDSIPPALQPFGLTPIAVDPNDTDAVYVGGTALFQSRDGGTSFRNLTSVDNGVSSIGVAPTNSQNVVVAERLGAAHARRVMLTTNALAPTVGGPGGVAFQTLPGLPQREVTRVVIDPNNDQQVFATLGGVGGGHVYRTTSASSGWTNISPPVDIAVNAIALDGTTSPTTIYIGTAFGVLRSDNGGSNWDVIDDVNLPRVPVSDLTLNTQAGILRASTYGRGAFELSCAPVTLACPGDIVASADPGQCSRGHVRYATPDAGDCPGATVSCDLPSGASFPVGESTVTCVASAGGREIGTCGFKVTIRDTESPAIACSSVTLPNDPGKCSAILQNPLATATDNCPGVTLVCDPPVGSVFPKGMTQVHCSATDVAGNASRCDASVTVRDVEPPSVGGMVARVSLWPPDHNLFNVGLSATAVDNCPGTLAVSVKINSDEDDVMPGDTGKFSPDAASAAPGTLRLRAERQGTSDGRVYLITTQAADTSGNKGFVCLTSVVPHDQSATSQESAVAQARVASSYCASHVGAPPLGYVVVGDGPREGPKQ